MVLVRPVKMGDLESLENLASLAGVGLTTLPKDAAILSKRILKSEAAFHEFPERPGGETFLFVMEDLTDKKVVGACGIVTKVGGFQPFWAYKIEKSLFESAQIGVRKEVPILTLYEEHDGPCEIGSLFLDPQYRREGNGRLLQLIRFLFIAEHPQSFEDQVVSEIRGVCDAEGHSPFWDAIGRHFFDIDFRRADFLSIVNKKFIAELMPDHPIYIPLLPESAQKVIGVPHEQSRPAVRNLEAEGMRFSGMVDIFDAGPIMIARQEEIRSVRESVRTPVGEPTDQLEGVPVHMICTSGDAPFRATRGPLRIEDGAARMSRQTMEILQVSPGSFVRSVPLFATPRAGT
jgi:arginine N-succinyltransferase